MRVTDLLHDGSGFGRDEAGNAWRVPGALPGDEVEVSGGGPGMNVANAAVRLRDSADRVAAYCEIAACGGCTLRELALPAAAQAKQRMVAHALKHEVAPIIARPELAYRHRVRLHVRGKQIGYHAHGSNQIVPLTRCPVLLPRFHERLLPLARRLVVNGEVEAVFSPVDDRLVIEAVVKAPDHTAFRKLITDGLCEGALVIDKGNPRRHGDPHVILQHPSHAEAKFFLEPGVFSQAHLTLNAELVRYVAAQAPQGRVLELHAGAGNLTLALGANVTATEWDEQAVMCLRRNVETHKTGARVEALGDLDAWKRHGAQAEVLVMDPPRQGAKQTAAAIAAAPHGLRRIIYVSCDPASLARDVTLLAGFKLVSAQPFDMFPGTAHVETVAVLDRV